MKAKHSEEIAKAIAEASTTVDALRDIAQVTVYKYSSDASTALRSGCVLLSVTPAHPEENSNRFLYLVGLPRGVPVSPWLSNNFKE